MPRKKQTFDVPVSYRTIFWVVVVMSFTSLAANFYLVMQEHQSESLARFSDHLSSTWKTGFGVVVGLLGGKRLP